MKSLANKPDHAQLLEAVKNASEGWQAAFNHGDAASCASYYETAATMQADPLGRFVGTTEIRQFWQNLIAQGFDSVEYIEPKVSVLTPDSALLTSMWLMNKASGVIHKELWVLQPDGTAKLREDHFEVLSPL